MPTDDPAQTRRLAERLRRVDADPRLQRLARAVRSRLPGDALYGDPLSVAGDDPPGVLGRRLAALSAQRPSALREVFTDLVGFSSWALDAGDTLAVDLLRQVGQGLEPVVSEEGGRVVKRLGDGLMAVFGDASSAIEAACRGQAAVRAISVDGYQPAMRAGVHVGRPRKLGGDYFGVDVNIAARVAAAAGAGEVLVSEAARQRLDDSVSLRRRWRVSAKGAPKDLRVYAAAVG